MILRQPGVFREGSGISILTEKAGRETEAQKRRLLRDLRSLGVREGDHVALGISFKSMGSIAGGAGTFLDALQHAVGPDGTIMVNTFTEQFALFRLRTRKIDYLFDHQSTPCNTGLIPELIRQRDGAVRSKHPVTSVTAIGSQARFLTESHDSLATAYSPFSKLAEINGKYLSVGIGGRLVGFRHEAQYRAGLLEVVPKKLGVNYLDEEGAVRLFVNRQPPGCVKTLGLLNQLLFDAGIVNSGKVGEASSILIPAKEALTLMTDALIADPSLNLCDEVFCLWCREIERRLDLRDTIDRPKYFQRYRIITALLASMNWFRLGDNPVITALWRSIKFLP